MESKGKSVTHKERAFLLLLDEILVLGGHDTEEYLCTTGSGGFEYCFVPVRIVEAEPNGEGIGGSSIGSLEIVLVRLKPLLDLSKRSTKNLSKGCAEVVNRILTEREGKKRANKVVSV